MAGMLLPFLFFLTKECVRHKDDLSSVFAQYENILVKRGIIKKSPSVVTKIKFSFSSKILSKAVTNGKNGWLFYTPTTDGWLLGDYEGKNYPSEEEYNKLKDSILNNYKFAKERGIKFILFIAPNKGNIYREYLPDSVKQASVMTTEYIVNRLKSEISDFPIVFPQEELLGLRTKYELYYPRDTHWNLLGAYIGYKKLMKDGFGVDVKPIESLKICEKQGHKGDLVDMVELSEYFPDMKECYIEEYEGSGYNKNSNNDSIIDKSLLVIHDSYGEKMKNYLRNTFSTVNYIHRDKYETKDFEKSKPSIIIFETVGRYLNNRCINFDFRKNITDSLHF